jgi:hypothetical protein
MAQDFTHYDAVIADLEAKRDQLNAMIETLKTMKGVTTLPIIGAVASATAARGGDAQIPGDAFFNMTMADAARAYLTIVKHTKPHVDLCDALLAGGFKTTSPNFREVVRSTLSRHGDFVKVNGQWGLKEWYGNRSGRRPRRIATQDEPPEGQREMNDELVESAPAAADGEGA